MSGAVLPLQSEPQIVKPRRPHRSSARQQATKIQRLLFEDVHKDMKPIERAAVARAWCDVNEESRKLAMRALPRPIDTTKHAVNSRRSRSAQAAPAEPVEPVAPPVKES